MRGKQGLSVSDKLLLAAYELEERGRRPFSAEDLVVAAWQKFPDAFGLAGYRGDDARLSYPDSNRVFAEIMGSKPIRKRGFLIKVGHKMYELTEAGRGYARHLSGLSSGSPSEKAALGREIEQPLRKLLSSKAAEKFRNKRVDEITFYDACAFWGITPASSAIELQGQIAKLEKMVELAREAIQEKTVTFGHGGHSFGAKDLDEILEVHRVLMQKFDTEIKIIEKRKDERRV